MAPLTQYHHHGRFPVAGGVLPDAITAYRTYGDISNPCIVFPTCFGAKLDSQLYMVGKGKVMDPEKYFIVTCALFSNGESSSPSNTPVPYNGPYFPAVTYEDNIRAQYGVLQALGVQKLFAVIGFSMGGQQAYHWPVMYPNFVERYIVICGSARTSPHNRCFLEGPKAALVASKDFENGHYQKTPQFGIRAFGRVYCAWAYGQAWFREHKYTMGGLYPDLPSFMRERWEGRFVELWDANDLVTLVNTWQSGDISKIRHNGDLGICLSQITAKGLIMPSKSSGRLVVIDTIWGHTAGGGSNPVDDAFVQAQIKAFLEE
ncbi:hypothetical protein HYPSUDRAFT_530822 [Hypholoma sublateritium FD-334 SS-4]|uniref:AB hydrolase-1 domain-containing protein n=1 Tax=Hypholoma sublateritium (strain FD-334 SS-4) TaxID=945553 RepID=A0A0D2NAY5_HYPSF|nr:hypothetical protein HYPSUDRAFT_530822 [Hypholoma sublateritium FD-334 SS-4]